jgi:dipeptidase E
MKNLLLLSNSRMPATEYLEHAVEAIRETIGDAKKIVLIPYASVTIAWDSTAKNVRKALESLGVEITAIHHFKDPAKALADADAIMVNGGNTFNLLHHLRRKEIIVPLRTQIFAGKPYVGWSAGSAICAPTIRTTNDMPIIDPSGLDAAGGVCGAQSDCASVWAARGRLAASPGRRDQITRPVSGQMVPVGD